MLGQPQPFSSGDFPHFQRLLRFLTNCGLSSYELEFSWYNQIRHLLHPFTHVENQWRNDWFKASDEITLLQKEQESMNASCFIGKIEIKILRAYSGGYYCAKLLNHRNSM